MNTELLEKNAVPAQTQPKKRNKMKLILSLMIAFILLLCVITMLVVVILMKQNFSRGEYPTYTANYRYDHYEAAYPREEVSFLSGKNMLKGWIYGAENEKGLIVLAHGIGGGHEGYINEIIWFVNRGWRVFAYDATGSCESEGSGTMGLPQSALDLDAALTFAEQDSRLSELPVFLFGHSWGGYAVTAVLHFNHTVAASASVAGYAVPMEMITEFAEGMMGKAAYAVYPFMWIYNQALFGKNASLSAVDAINSTDTPVLIIHGSEDKMISDSSILSKQEEIINPNVEYLLYTAEGQNGHNSIFFSKDSLAYIEQTNQKWEELYRKYDGEIPDSEKETFYASVEKEKINAVNEDLLNRINTFYEQHLQG